MPRRAMTRDGVAVADAIMPTTSSLLSDRGTAGLSLAALARDLGVSIRPIRNRYTDTGALLVHAWQSRLWPSLAERLAALAVARGAADLMQLSDLLRQSLRRDPDSDAAAELMLHARFDAHLQQAVDQTLGKLITDLTTPATEQNAANAFVIAPALGLMIGARHERAENLDLDSALPDWLTAATNPVPGQPLPAADASHMDDYPVLAPGDPALDILLNTALELISTRGFDQVTVSQIAREAGYTEGLAFRRYPSKLDMLRDATKRQNDAGLELNHAFTTQLQTTHGTAIAESVIIREAQRPGRELGRSMALEQIRLGWHHRDLAQAQKASLDEFRAALLTTPGWDAYESETDFFLQFALSWGMYLLPFLSPDAHRLPYDSVLVPLYDIFETRHGSTS